jgi:hypothetical protein
MKISNEMLRAKIGAARSQVGAAEIELGRLIDLLASAPRADKTTVTPALEAAFASLRKATAELVELEGLLMAER